MSEAPPDSPVSLERRSAPRVGISATVRVHGDHSWSGIYKTGDLSISGAFLISETPPPRGSMVTLDIEFGQDEEKIVGLSALVVHVRNDASEAYARGCGVVFLRLGKEETEKLKSILASKL